MNITKDDIPYHLHIMVDVIGYDKFLEICKMYGGTAIYIPVHRKIILGERNKNLIKDFNGRNLEELRCKYNLSKEQVRRIVESERLKYE